ncbi:MAG: hypothetical protein DRI34_12970 [Deltaproteobacteria bacterium]|nr:MAG: hypothetical protein DRI34_12970 [Deltaproteobacteria bacterium]
MNFILSDLVLVERQHGRQVEVTALSGASGEPLRGAEVALYQYNWRSGHRAVATKTTGRDGTVIFHREDNRQYFLYARRGRQVALDPNYLYLYARRPVEKTTATLLYTDRSVYRPGQKLQFKAVVYSGRRSRADYHTLAGRKVRVWLQDANRKSVADATFTTNERGTVAGEFTIPAGRMLGQWQLRASPSGRALVRVEEYKRPTFEVKIIEAKKALRLNRRARLEGQARYYFGLPVNAGRVNWRVERTPLYPWWWGWWYGSAVAQSQVVATGTARLDEEGKFAVEFVPRADERLADTGISYNYRLSAEVTDEGGETRTAQRSFRLGFVAVEGRFVLEKGFLLAGRPEKIRVQRSNLDGAAAPGSGKWELYRLRQPAETRLPAAQPLPESPGLQQDRGFATRGDRQRERWRPNYSAQAVLYGWADGKRLAGGRLTHDEKGQAEFELPALPPGAYRLRYRTRDAFGKEFSTQRELVVAGEGLELKLPLYFAQELGTVKVGDRARFLVHSGLPGQVLVVEFWRDGRRTERRLLRAGRDSGLIELPVGEGDRGGYGITVFAVRDHQYLVNQGNVMVPWDNHELKVSFATFRDRLRPGQRESWTVKVTGPAGKDSAVAGAEVLAYMYDRSLDIFAPHNPPSVLSVYPSFMNAASLRASLYQARQSWVSCDGFPGPGSSPTLHPARLAMLSGYGIGGIGYGRGGRILRKRGMALPAAAPRASRGDVVLDEAAHAEREMPAATGSAAGKDKTLLGVLRAGGGKAPARPAGGERAGVAGQAAPVQLRQDFSETAFFQPQLVTGADGTVELRFAVPDSVTAWNVWVHAITRDLSSGSLKKEARSVKELMVRPYLPRFLREGDRAELRVVVQNAGESKLAGELQFDIIDPATERSLLDEFGLQPGRARRKFSVEPGGSSSEVFVVKAPVRVGQVAVRVVARAGAFSDGELRPLPLLPGRMHLMQSRFVTVKGGQLRRLHFADMERSDDPSRIDEQLVVTLDAQLFYSVLAAVPYLVNYPYECTEQLLNRFLSAGIMASLYARYPALERLGRKLGRRRTQYESFDRPDANRKLALEETPWLVESRGGGVPGKDLVKILVPEVARAHRLVTLAKLKKAQTSSGGFPWFPGGPPSPYMTLYLLYGFSKGLEFGVEVPKGMVKRAWRYEKRHYLDHLVRECLEEDLCWEEITFLNYVLSNYPDASWWGEMFSDAERRRMLDFSFKHWKEHAPLLKGYLALTLKRMGRGRDARLVWASVMDSAHSDPDTGTSWAPEDRGWLWYNDSIETHALAVRVEMEIDPRDEKLEGLVQWLFLNKKLNHWKSTKATAEVVYSLAHYLKKTGQLGRQQRARVKVGDLVKDYLFRPDEYTGKSNQLVIAPPRLDARKQATVEVENRSRGMMFASATWHFSTEKLPAEARGDLLQVRREYFRRVKTGREVVLRPLADGERIEVGDELEVHISLRAKHPAGYVHLRDPRPAGCEPVSLRSRHRWALGVYWYEEVRDSGTNFFFERLPQGEYPFKYRLRAAVAGTFKVAPATVQPMYAPEFAAYSAGNTISIQPAK